MPPEAIDESAMRNNRTVPDDTRIAGLLTPVCGPTRGRRGCGVGEVRGRWRVGTGGRSIGGACASLSLGAEEQQGCCANCQDCQYRCHVLNKSALHFWSIPPIVARFSDPTGFQLVLAAGKSRSRFASPARRPCCPV